jgi:hypothetical protein
MAKQVQIKRTTPVRSTDRPSNSNPEAGIDRRTPSGKETRN